MLLTIPLSILNHLPPYLKNGINQNIDSTFCMRFTLLMLRISIMFLCIILRLLCSIFISKKVYSTIAPARLVENPDGYGLQSIHAYFQSWKGEIILKTSRQMAKIRFNSLKIITSNGVPFLHDMMVSIGLDLEFVSVLFHGLS